MTPLDRKEQRGDRFHLDKKCRTVEDAASLALVSTYAQIFFSSRPVFSCAGAWRRGGALGLTGR